MSIKVGLTLSGGGAKGAYQVGIVKALAEFKVEIQAISGASIGSLNGGVISSSPNLNIAFRNLQNLWLELANSQILQSNPSSYFLFLQKAGLKFNGAVVRNVFEKFGWNLGHFIEEEGLIKENPLDEMMEAFLKPSVLDKGIPLFVSAYESQGFLYDIVNAIPSLLHLTKGKNSDFFHIQSLPVSQQKSALLASAAIPFLFQPKKINGQIYSDGGLGGWKNSQGNTPVTPLIEYGCDLIIVSHLEDGSLWDRDQFPNTTFIEIRPQSSVSRDLGFLGGAKDVLGFDSKNINSWIDQGYDDAHHCLGRVIDALTSRNNLENSKTSLDFSESANAKADKSLEKSMVLIRD